MVISWKWLLCGMHYFMTSTCDTESKFNDSTNQRYHLLNHHKELEHLNHIWAWQADAYKVTTKQKTESNITITEKKEKQ